QSPREVDVQVDETGHQGPVTQVDDLFGSRLGRPGRHDAGDLPVRDDHLDAGERLRRGAIDDPGRPEDQPVAHSAAVSWVRQLGESGILDAAPVSSIRIPTPFTKATPPPERRTISIRFRSSPSVAPSCMAFFMWVRMAMSWCFMQLPRRIIISLYFGGMGPSRRQAFIIVY